MIIGASGAKPSRTADLERKLVHHCSPALAGLKPANMFVYREGIDADAFQAASVHFAGDRAGKLPTPDLSCCPLVFCAARNMDDSKGIDVLAEAASIILKNWPESAGINRPQAR